MHHGMDHMNHATMTGAGTNTTVMNRWGAKVDTRHVLRQSNRSCRYPHGLYGHEYDDYGYEYN